MFKHLFDPSSIIAIRLPIVLIQAGAAVLILTTIIAIRRWLLTPIMRRLRDGPRARHDAIRQWRVSGMGQD